jgi:hypothetical protein
VFYLNVAKVDLDVCMHAYCKSMFQILHTYVASVSCEYCICHVFQVFLVFCKYFRRIL